MPVGVIVFIEHWIFPKIGFTQYRAARKNLLLNWPALLSWLIAVTVALVLERTGLLHLFFLFIPTFILTAGLYILFSAMAGARQKLPELVLQHSIHKEFSNSVKADSKFDIKAWVWGIIACLTLIICIIMSIRVYFSTPELYERNFTMFKNLLIWPTLAYFVSATGWAIRHEK
jgi:cytosine permease